MIWQCFITLVGSCKAILYIPGELLSKFTVRKAIHMEMVVQYKHQNVLVYQSCTMEKVF